MYHIPPPSPHLSPPHLSPPHLSPPHLSPPHLSPPHLSPPHLSPPHLSPPHLSPPHLTTPGPGADDSDTQGAIQLHEQAHSPGDGDTRFPVPCRGGQTKGVGLWWRQQLYLANLPSLSHLLQVSQFNQPLP